MKKALLVLLACLSVFLGIGKAYAKDEIEGIYTMVGSYGFNSYVPYDISVFGGDLVVSDKDNHRISVIDINTSKVKSTYGRYGSGKGEFRYPRGLAVNGKELLVCDSYNNRIVILNSAYEQVGVIQLETAPKDIGFLDDKLYVLLFDGMTIESYAYTSKEKINTYALKYSAENISCAKSHIIASGYEGVHTIDIQTRAYEELEALKGAIGIHTNKDNIYALFDGKAAIYNNKYEKQNEFSVNKGTSIYGDELGVYVASISKGLVYAYREGGVTATYGKERKEGERIKVSSINNYIAVAMEDIIYLYEAGEPVASVSEKDIVDIKITADTLYVLKKNKITGYSIKKEGEGKVALISCGEQAANPSYNFTALEERKGTIYICESYSGKLLKVGKDMKVFSTAINMLNSPKAVVAFDEGFYIANKDMIGKYDINGALVKEVKGEYSALAYREGVLYAINRGGSRLSCFNEELEKIDPVSYDGYFLDLIDIEGNERGIYICDHLRKEVMLYAGESLELSSENLTIGNQIYSGRVSKGQTVQVAVTGAGMLNRFPNNGDIRYRPTMLVADGEVAFERVNDLYVASTSFENVGNFTLKVEYQREKYQQGSWVKDQRANSVEAKEIPVMVVNDKIEEDKADSYMTLIDEILKTICDMFSNKE